MILAASLFPFKAYGNSINIDTGACTTENPTCSHWKLVSNGDTNFLNSVRLNGGSHGHGGWIGHYSTLQVFNGVISDMLFDGVYLNAPRLNMSSAGDTPRTIKDSDITSDMWGSFYTVNITNSNIKGFITTYGGGQHLHDTFNFDGSNVTGSIIDVGNVTGNKVSLSFSNGSVFRGDIIINNTAAYNASTGYNSSGYLYTTFKDSTWYGNFKDIQADPHFENHLAIINTQVNPDSDTPTDFNFVNGKNDVGIENSNLNANIYNQAHLNLSLRNSSMKEFYHMYGAHDSILNADNTFYLENSSVDYVAVTGGIVNITAKNSTIGKKDNGHGEIAIFDSGGWWSLTASDTTINGSIYSDAYDSFSIQAKNVTINGDSSGYAIRNYYGTMQNSKFDHSTINGSIIWMNSTFNGNGDTNYNSDGEGLLFANGSVLNGDLNHLDEIYGSNKDGANFSFDNSTMNGSIIDTTTASTAKDSTSIDRVMFRASTLNGDIFISSKNLKYPSIVDMGVGFYVSAFNFKSIKVKSDDSATKPKLYLSLNETQMSGEDILNQGDLDIRAGRNSSIKANITTGFGDNNELMKNPTFNLILDDKDRVINKGMTNKNTDGTDKTYNPDDPTKPSSYEGRLITAKTAKNTITLNYGSMSLLSGSNVNAKLIANTGKNALMMQDSIVYLQGGSSFNGSLNSTGYNRLTLDPNVSINLTDTSSYMGSLVTSNGSGIININAKTQLFLKPNETSANMPTDMTKPTQSIGFEGTLIDNTAGGNYLEMDSTQAVSNGEGVDDEWVALVLDKGTSTAKNTFKGTLFTKGEKNYLYLGSYSDFTLDAGSFFDGVLIAKDSTAFDNQNGNVTLESGSNFVGALSANTLTLKGATVLNSNTAIIKAVQVLSGENDLTFSANTTAPILNDGGTLYLSFNPNSSASPLSAISFKGGIYTYGGATSIDFTKTLYVDPNTSTILASGKAINNISYNSDLATIGAFSSLLAQIPDELPVYNIYTQDEARNNFAISGPFSAKANIYYTGGYTTLILADTPSGTVDLKGGNAPSDIASGKLNGYTYQDGLLINLDAQKADKILKPYRDIYPTNFASLSIDKLSSVKQAGQAAACKADSTKCLSDDDSTKISGFLTSDGKPIYKAYLDGILVGDVSSLETSLSVANKEYLAVLSPSAAFIGSVEIKDTPISINLSGGSKVIFTKDSTIETLESTSRGIDTSSLLAATLSQRNNTIIDLATEANADNVVKKDDYSTLSINNLDNVQNVIFKFSFGKDSTGKNDADRLVVANTTNSKNNVIEIYQNLSHPTELKDGEKILVASIANGGSVQNGKIFGSGEIVNHEGFDVVTSHIVVLDQNSNDPTTATAGATYSNYYLSSMTSSINPQAANLSKAALNSNRSILLSNINDLNKRLGELRDNPYAQGAWARIFNGMTSSDYGVEMKNNFTNVQAGYDYSVGNLKNANQYVGFAISYGYNNLNASGVELAGSGNMVELGAYYSYVGDSGLYTDSILKYAFINNKLSISANQSTINYNTNAVTFGQEVGYRFFLDKNKRFYIDPLAEITLGYFGDGNINQIKGEAFLNSKFDANLLYRVKVGGNMGYKLITSRNETDFRAGLSYLLDGTTGDISMNSNLSSETNKIPLSNTGLLQLGVNSIISSNWRAYVDLDVGFGSKIFRQDYLISLGGRYIFGKKSKSSPIDVKPISKSHH